jgi:bifunctional non-homologous end joining protein LigD
MRYKKIEGGEKLKSFVTPMLAQLTDQPPFDDPGWLFEIKWDGYRAVAEISRKGCRLYSRNGLSFAKAYGKVFEALKKIRHEAVIDGEIVVFDENNQPSFQKLQNYASTSSATIHYFVFDILNLDGKDVTGMPLLERKELLQSIIPKNDVIQYCDHIVGSGKAFYKEIEKSNMEGMIAKRINSKYYPGKRTTDWLKLKNVRSEEAIIVGFTAPKGSRVGFGSLLLGQYIRRKLTYIGNVGTGFNDQTLKQLHKKFKLLERQTSPLDHSVKPPPATTWIEPELVCNIKFTEKTTEGMVRHPVFLGLRVDKTANEVKPELSLKSSSRGPRRK